MSYASSGVCTPPLISVEKTGLLEYLPVVYPMRDPEAALQSTNDVVFADVQVGEVTLTIIYLLLKTKSLRATCS